MNQKKFSLVLGLFYTAQTLRIKRAKLTIGFHFTLVLMFFYTAQTLRINHAKVTIALCFTLKRERPK